MGIELDSEEEKQFFCWCLEAKEHGFIEAFYYQPEPFLLSCKGEIKFEVPGKTKMLKKTQHIVHPHIYTADFLFKPTDKFHKLNHKLKPHHLWKEWNGWHYVDVKGTFNAHGGDLTLSIHQKWVWQIFNVYINKVVPSKFFKLTWCPKAIRYMKNRKELTVKKSFIGSKTVEEIGL